MSEMRAVCDKNHVYILPHQLKSHTAFSILHLVDALEQLRNAPCGLDKTLGGDPAEADAEEAGLDGVAALARREDYLALAADAGPELPLRLPRGRRQPPPVGVVVVVERRRMGVFIREIVHTFSTIIDCKRGNVSSQRMSKPTPEPPRRLHHPASCLRSIHTNMAEVASAKGIPAPRSAAEKVA